MGGARRGLVTLDEAIAYADAEAGSWSPGTGFRYTAGQQQSHTESSMGDAEAGSWSPGTGVRCAASQEQSHTESSMEEGGHPPPAPPAPRVGAPGVGGPEIETVPGAIAPIARVPGVGAPGDGAPGIGVVPGTIAPIAQLAAVTPALDEEAAPVLAGAPMLMMAEEADEAPPLVLCVSKTSITDHDPTRLEPPAAFDCGVKDLIKACVLL